MTLGALGIPLGDPAMGGHCDFVFGSRWRCRHRKGVLFDSEGDLQMSLGILLTVAEQKPENSITSCSTTSATR